MRYLIDQNLSRAVVVRLADAGHDAVHLRDYGMQQADDETILARARDEERVLISADTDFGELLARQGCLRPSVILFRPGQGRHPRELAELLLDNMETVGAAVEAGSVVVFARNRIRVRSLPLPPAHP